MVGTVAVVVPLLLVGIYWGGVTVVLWAAAAAAAAAVQIQLLTEKVVAIIAAVPRTGRGD